MASPTTTTALSDALPLVIASARIFREYESIMTKTVDKQTLAEGSGLDWFEDRIEQLTAMDITETTVLDNAQQLADTRFNIRPLVSGIQTIITNRAMKRISKNVAALVGQAAQLAMERKKDVDGLSQFANFSNTLAGTGVTLTAGHVFAGVSRILGNSTETGAGEGPINLVLHPFGVKDLQDELTAGIGTYVVPTGLSADTYRRGFEGTIGGANLWIDGNIAIVSNDARGAVFAQNAIVLVQGFSPTAKHRDRPELGGGADEIFLYDEYAYGERRDVWGYALLHDATAPTS